LDDLGHDGEGDLFGGLGVDVQADGGLDAGDLFAAQAERLQAVTRLAWVLRLPRAPM
jgi:hypothetical protein